MGVASLVTGSIIDCTSRISRWNELIFCVVLQIQESLKLLHWFLSGCGQKMGMDYIVHETLKSAYLKDECMNWADVLHSDCDAIIFC